MAICLKFELVEVVDTTARYRFGGCNEVLDGVFEIDITKLVRGDIDGDTPISQVVRLMNDKQSQSMANRVFGEIYRHYLKDSKYPEEGGYYA
ncbi:MULTISPECIES: hypothetical protein [Paenibacillus]|uniref:hypothetical protein n=1 Tax=Paenibacillus TaxID=44249 RepID=UPI0022B915B0|nr:hypothetical protein [Paenibacillus caseinilyticus]MCZ8518484.1 hypothetical protein [Paenibacillus caseinilyticus]